MVCVAAARWMRPSMKSRTGDGAVVCVAAASTAVIARTSWGLGSSLVARCARASIAAPAMAAWVSGLARCASMARAVSSDHCPRAAALYPLSVRGWPSVE